MLKLNIDQLARQKALNEKRDINANVVARETGIPYATVYAYWNNDTTSAQFEKLGILAAYFDCSIDELFEETNASSESQAPKLIGLGAAL